METFVIDDVALGTSINVTADGDDPTGATLGGPQKVLARGLKNLQNKVSPLAASTTRYRTGWSFLQGIAGGDGIAPVEKWDGTFERIWVECTGRSTIATFEIFPPHGALMQGVELRLRVDTTTDGGPGSTPVLVELRQQDNTNTVDVGGGFGFMPTLATLATGTDASANAAAMVLPHTIAATVAGAGHAVNRETSRYFVRVRGQSGTGTGAAIKTWYLGLRTVTTIPAGGSIDLGAG